MAGSLNQVNLLGNLGADPEIRALDNGSTVANFSIATSESWNDKTSGEKKTKTEWHRVTVWQSGDRGLVTNVVQKYLTKGSKVFVQGQLQTRKWQDQEGNDRYSTEVVLTGFQAQLILCGGTNEPRAQGEIGPNESAASLHDDIPF
jgi:single-strand DNA-binding protein